MRLQAPRDTKHTRRPAPRDLGREKLARARARGALQRGARARGRLVGRIHGERAAPSPARGQRWARARGARTFKDLRKCRSWQALARASCLQQTTSRSSATPSRHSLSNTCRRRLASSQPNGSPSTPSAACAAYSSPHVATGVSAHQLAPLCARVRRARLPSIHKVLASSHLLPLTDHSAS
jgi:hypothetical protein